MKIIETPLQGLFVLETINFKDERGVFQKIYNEDFFKENGLVSDFKEIYFSISQKDVLRGMHFQKPPYDHVKLVHLSCGHILDVVVDLRLSSQTYGKYFSLEMKEDKAQYLYIPKGFAHGFKSLQDNSILNYAQTSCYHKESDSGIAYNSFGFDWALEKPIVSERDTTFVNFKNFKSPFK